MIGTIFISYSHDSLAHKQTVLGLAERLRKDGLHAWIDQYEPGKPVQGWPRWILDQFDAAAFVLVVCTDRYYQHFRGHGEPGYGQGVDFEGALITQEIYNARSRTAKFVPVLLTPGLEDRIPEPLRGSYYELTSEAAYSNLLAFLRGAAGVEPRPIGAVHVPPRPRGTPLTFGTSAAQRVAPSRLPRTTGQLFGRERELADLDAAWNDRGTRVVTVVAMGGVGKTALIANWVAQLAGRNHDGADYFDWSFYSQGTRNEGAASADLFVDAALRFFGDEGMADSPSSPWDKGARLAQLLSERRTLLVLDGLEPLQHGVGPLAGDLKDLAVSALLKGLAARNPGLCVVTTRESVTDLREHRRTTTPEWKLEHLSTAAAVAFLKSLGVHGSASEFERLVEDVHGHALTLSLLGRFLKIAHDGDVGKRSVVQFHEADDEILGGHAFRVMAAYERWFANEGDAGRRIFAVLRLLGLFDRPAVPRLLVALRQPPAIFGLTDPIVDISDAQWKIGISRLTDCGLVIAQHDGSVDAHPLVREYLSCQLRDKSPETWRAAHRRLHEYLCASTQDRPEDFSGLQALYQAVVHGCYAGMHEIALSEVYARRILRGDQRYSWRQFGRFGLELSTLAAFFDDPRDRWDRPSSMLDQAGRPLVLRECGFALQALGRLPEATSPMRIAVELCVQGEDHAGAALAATNLSKNYLYQGELVRALSAAQLAGSQARVVSAELLLVGATCAEADALFRMGRLDEAEVAFRKAEVLHAKLDPEWPQLYSFRGYRYCEFLMQRSEFREVLGRVRSWIAAETSRDVSPFSRGLNRTMWCFVSQHLPEEVLSERVADEAISFLTTASQVHHIPRAYLARAALRSQRGRLQDALVDAEEALDRSQSMGLHILAVDASLIAGRLCSQLFRLITSEAARYRDRARTHFDNAAHLTSRVGYNLRVSDIGQERALLEAIV